MIHLHHKEKISNIFEIKNRIHGKGIFYITNYGVYFESRKHGMIIMISFEQMKTYNVVKKNIFQIVWETESNDRFIYEISSNSVKEIMIAYQDSNNKYAKSMTEIQAFKS